MTSAMVDVAADDKRAAAMTGLLVAAVVLVLGLGSGIGAIFHRTSSHKAPSKSAIASGDAALAAPDGVVTGVPSGGAAISAHLASHTIALSPDSGAGTVAPGATPESGASAGDLGAATCVPTPAAAEMLDPFVVHLDHAHLEEGPAQQVSDLLNVNQYVKTHTVLLENMLVPVFKLLLTVPDDVNPFVVHVDHAHLEEAPAQQVSDLLNVSQYVKTHTVLVENMVAPSLAVLDGAC